MSVERTGAEDFRETVCARLRTLMCPEPSDKSLGALRFPAGRTEASSCFPSGERIAVCEASHLVLSAGKTFQEVLDAELSGPGPWPLGANGVDRRGISLPWAGSGPSLDRFGPWNLEGLNQTACGGKLTMPQEREERGRGFALASFFPKQELPPAAQNQGPPHS